MKNNNFKGIIFDLDGTLIDSFEPIHLSFNHALTTLGYTEQSFEKTMKLVGMGLEDTFFFLLGESALAEKATKTFRELYGKIYLEKTSLIPYVEKTVEELYSRGYRLSVATNKLGKYSREIINHLGLSKWIDTVIGVGDGVIVKPDPEILNAAAEGSGIKLNEALFVGDSKIDIDTGKNADVPVVAVATGVESYETLLSLNPYHVIKNLSELTQIL